MVLSFLSLYILQHSQKKIYKLCTSIKYIYTARFPALPGSLYFEDSLHRVSLFPVPSVLPSLIDRLGDAKDQVRDQDQMLLLKIMEQAASPQVDTHTGHTLAHTVLGRTHRSISM